MCTIPETLCSALDCVASEVLDQARVCRPPVDALELARALNMVVMWDERQHGRARYVRMTGCREWGSQGTILLHPEPRCERRHWAVAHEIGEHMAWRVFEELGREARETATTTRETIANHLAGRLLIPSPWFLADATSCQWDLIDLKARYRTASHELLARRMLEFAPPIIVSIFDQGRLGLRQSNVDGQVPPLSHAEIKCWRVIHEQNRPYTVKHGQLSIRGWPIHEIDWKREILRTELSAR